ncbi:methionine/alanine import family NSS transporter small subunit [Sanguibacter sp. Z1732]|uniref:methionine/alanine import family NSS transporter small subunit n=1 Tax=Sanguibacter sp. Z1732 TaxID=3435412 RepID=UPI003D9CAE1E
MDTPAIIMMIVALVTVWGGMATAIIHLSPTPRTTTPARRPDRLDRCICAPLVPDWMVLVVTATTTAHVGGRNASEHR